MLSDWLQRLVMHVHQFVYERTGGRVGRSLAGRPMLLLRTTGRKSGQLRTAMLLYVRDGDDYAVIASRGGSPHHPAWYLNLQANPEAEIQVGTETVPVRAHDAEGEDRARIWKLANDVNRGGYDNYQRRTDRQIPVVVLEPR